MNRRDFINISTLTGSALLMDNLQVMAKPLPSKKSLPGFQLTILATNWGYTGSWEQFCSQIKNEGYDGAEFWFPEDKTTRDEILAAFKKYDLQYAFLIGSGDSNYQKKLSGV